MKQTEYARNGGTTKTLDICELAVELENVVPIHPFAKLIAVNRMKPLLENYLAMSMAFPYLQSGSCAETILRCISQGIEIPVHFEKSSIVGSFLVWDELGGWYKTSQQGHAGLPGILDSNGVHATLLKSDLEAIFGHKVKARFEDQTKKYLLELYRALSSDNPCTRCAAMVTFELHAERMINALWQTIARIFGVDKLTLKYFNSHVGGDNPAEAYHVQMTQNLITALIEPKMFERFKAESMRLYLMHIQWCEDICNLEPQEKKHV